MLALQCVNCNRLHKPETMKRWGQTKESSGYGREARCTALVPGSGPKAPDGSEPLEWCGGLLAPFTLAAEIEADAGGVTARSVEGGEIAVDKAGNRYEFHPITPL